VSSLYFLPNRKGHSIDEGGADDQQLGFEHFIADVEDSNVEFKQSQKVHPSILFVENQLMRIGPYTL